MGGTEEAEDPESWPGLGDEDFPGFPADICPVELPNLSRHHSLLADIFREDPSMYGRLREKKTRLGVGLARCIKVGIDNRGHKMVKGVGVVAGDEECFGVFRELFDRAIQLQHSDAAVVGICESQPTDLGRHGSRLTSECADPSGKYVLSSHVRASRNLAGFRFSPAMSRQERHDVEGLLAGALIDACGAEPNGAYLPLMGSESYEPQPGGMSAEEEMALQDAGLLFEAPDSTWRLCTGAGRHWPDGRGVFASGDRTLVAWVNELEHLRLTAVQQGAGLQLAFQTVVQTLDAVADILHRKGHVSGRHAYAYNERLGFLTSNVGSLGTAMSVSMTARLPLLSQQQSSHWREWCAVQRVQVRSTLSGIDGDQLPGVFEFSNLDRLGISEVATVNLVIHVVHKLVKMEQRLELGLSLDDLLGCIELDAVPRAPPAAAPAEAKGAAQKALSTLLFGLAAGRLHSASSSGQEATHAVGGPECLRDIQNSAAQQFVMDVLEVAVDGHVGSQGSYPQSINAEEVLSDCGDLCTRPTTGESMVTLNGASEVSVNAATAMEVVDALIDSEVEARAAAVRSPDEGGLPAASVQKASTTGVAQSKAQVLQVKRKVCALLQNACASGEFARALSSIEQTTPGAKEGRPEAETGAGECLTTMRSEMAALLGEGAFSGKLGAALSRSQAKIAREAERERTEKLRRATAEAITKAERSGELQAVLRSLQDGNSAANGVGEEPAVEEAQLVVAVPEASPPAPSARKMRPAVLVTLRLLSGHDQRLGQLEGQIEFARRRLAQRSETCEQLQGMIESAKQEVAHLDLDIQWHARALESAEERSAELELAQRRLVGCLDLQRQKGSLDGGPSIMSARSELSTCAGLTGSSSAVSTCSYTPRIGHAMLEPLTHRLQTS